MGGDKRSVDYTPRDFLAAWEGGDAGPVAGGACTAAATTPAPSWTRSAIESA